MKKAHGAIQVGIYHIFRQDAKGNLRQLTRNALDEENFQHIEQL